MNKAKRIVDNMDSENAFAVCSEIGIIDENATPLKQARYINELLNTTESMKIYMTDTMRKCGGKWDKCYKRHIICYNHAAKEIQSYKNCNKLPHFSCSCKKGMSDFFKNAVLHIAFRYYHQTPQYSK